MYLETTGNHAMMRMNTDDSQSGRGFFLKYSIKCNRTINADSGVIESPNFPNDYPHNTDCAWTIVVSRGNKISYQFSHFHLENDNQFHNETNDHICKYDYVEISQDSEERNYEPKLKCNSILRSKLCWHLPVFFSRLQRCTGCKNKLRQLRDHSVSHRYFRCWFWLPNGMVCRRVRRPADSSRGNVDLAQLSQKIQPPGESLGLTFLN